MFAFTGQSRSQSKLPANSELEGYDVLPGLRLRLADIFNVLKEKKA